MLRQIEALRVFHGCPVVCSGDVFDKPNPPVELVNWAIKHLPPMYAIPGQHDLPHHRLSDKQKSAYWTLCEAGRITDLNPGVPLEVNELRLYGFPWGVDIEPCKYQHSLILEVAVIHAYLWTKNTGYPGAPENRRLGAYTQRLEGYDFALFGDNHKRVSYNLKGEREGPAVFNPGSLMRRTSDQKAHQPCVGLLHSNGELKIHELDCDSDVFLDTEEVQKTYLNGLHAAEFLCDLATLADTGVNFREFLTRFMDKEMVPQGVREIVLSCLEAKK